MAERLLNIDQIAEYLGLSRQKVKDLVKRGIIPAYRIAGSFLRFDTKEIDAKRGDILKVAQVPAAGEYVYGEKSKATFMDRLKDLFYFNDFYIVCAILITIVLVLIFKY